MLPTNQLITLYADTSQEIHEIYRSLIADTGWDTIESQKRVVTNGLRMEQPQHGQMRYSYQDKDYWSLELNNAAGFAELQTHKHD